MKNSNFWLPGTQKVFDKLATSAQALLSHFVLVGGSALAMHLGHRQSEVLDFFTYEDIFNRRGIFSLMRLFGKKEILHESDEQIDLFLDGVRVTFFNSNLSFLSPASSASPVHVASVEQIAAMKTNVLFMRARFRDYYDLYAISKERLTLREIYKNAGTVVDGLNFKLFSIALIYTEDVEDDNIEHLHPKYKITKEAISEYFITELKKLK